MRRLVARAAELGDDEALATATGNRFGRAINARFDDACQRAALSVASAAELGHAHRLATASRPGFSSSPRAIAHAERIADAIDSELWPESILRDECRTALSIAEPNTLPAGSTTLAYASALAQVAAWLRTRDPSERAARDQLGQLTFADGQGRGSALARGPRLPLR